MKKKIFSILFALVLVVSLSLVTAVPAMATTITVGPGGPPTYDYATIQAAINAASSGDTIVVAAGTYKESITINKQLTLQSQDGPETTIIDGDRTPGTLVSITAGGVTFSGFTVQNKRSGIAVGSSGNFISNNIVADISYWSLTVGGTDNYFDGNVIRDAGSWGAERQPRGFFIYGATNTIATNNRLVNAGFDGSASLEKLLSHDIDTSNTVNGKPFYYLKEQTGGTVPDGAGQVWLIGCTGVTVENQEISNTESGIYLMYSSGNTIRNNTLTRLQWRGIILQYDCVGNIISGNTVSDSLWDAKDVGGIEVRSSCNGNTITENTVSGCREGIVVCGSTENTITDNHIYGNRDLLGDGTHLPSGIILWNSSSQNLVAGNKVYDNGLWGIRVWGNSSGNTIEGNDIRNNRIGICLDISSNDNTITYNSITSNTDYGVFADELSIGNDARFNWWGDASGPYHAVLNPEGLGNGVSDNVLFDPWLKARPATPMSSFTIDHAKVDFKKKADDDKVRVQGKLELDLVNGNGVDISEDVIVIVGPLSETTRMEEMGKKGEKWQYQRPKDGEGNIKHMTINWKNGDFDIRMDKADLTGVTNPVTISVQIGDDLGSASILMREKEHHWDYKAK